MPNAVAATVNPAFAASNEPIFGANSNARKGKYKRREGNEKLKWIVLTFFLLMGLTAVVTILTRPDAVGKLTGASGTAATKSKSGEAGESPQTNAGTTTATSGTPGNNANPAVLEGAFPRRLLLVNINNYLYANPTQSGYQKIADEKLRTDIHSVIDRLADRWRIEKDQVYKLSDTLLNDPRNLLKPVIEETVDKFLATSRAQDRIMLIFACQAIAINGAAYLIPQEGDLDKPETLVPVKEAIYDKLAQCKAQQKVVIFDVCRYDPGRGQERPGGGPMSPELEKALHSPPPGVQVWTSCSAGESSIEYDYVEYPSRLKPAGRDIAGSLFISYIRMAMAAGQAGGGGISRQTDPLPIQTLINYVTPRVTDAANGLEKAKQTPKFTDNAAGTPQVAFNGQEPMPPRFELPRAKTGMAKEAIVSLLKEIDVPPIKNTRKGAIPIKIEDIVAFSEEAMREYMSDNVPMNDMRDKSKYPIRAVTIKAIETIRRTKAEGSEQPLPDELRQSETGDADLNNLKKIQENQATFQLEFEELYQEMLEAGKMREKEKSKRWLANYDYALAQVQMRLAYLNEYNFALGKVRKKELPELDPNLGHKGWRLQANEKMGAPKEVRDMAEKGKEQLKKIMEEYPNTPWAVVAKRDSSTQLGLKWIASSFGAADD